MKVISKEHGFFPFFACLNSLWAKILFSYALPVLLLVFIWTSFLLSETSKNSRNELIQYRRTSNNDIVTSLENNANALHIQSYVVYSDINNLLTIFDGPSKNGYYSASRDFRTAMLNYMMLTKQFDGLALLDFEGNILFFCDRKHSAASSQNVFEEDWYQSVLEDSGKNTNLFFTRKLLSDSTVVATTCKILYDPVRYEKVGIIACFSYLNNFAKIIPDSLMVNGEQAQLLNKDQESLYSTHEQLNSASLVKHYEEYDIVTFGKQMMLLTSASSARYGLTIISATPFGGFQKDSFVKNTNIIIFLLILLIALCVSAIISHRITQPLEQLMVSFKRVEEGDFKAQVAVKGKDELARIGTVYNQMLCKIDILTKERYMLKLAKTQSEIEALQSQINPHFLFNTLNSIKAMSNSGQSHKAAQMVQALSSLMRYSLGHGKYIVAFYEELDILKQYLYLQEYRFGGRYNVTYDIEEETMDMEIPRLSIQPLVENAIKHGLEPFSGQGRLIITAKVIAEQLYIYISNNGVPILHEKLDELNRRLKEIKDHNDFAYDKVGLLNVWYRLRLHYENECGMTISSTEKFTTIKMFLPAKRINIEAKAKRTVND